MNTIELALHAATRAPSVHNTQPWRFVVAPPHIDLCLDRERVLTEADAHGREARLSCGAALLNLRVALRAAGRGTVVDLLPDAARPDLLARLRVVGSRAPTPAQLDLATAIERRTTNRRPFSERPVPAKHRAALVRAAEEEGAGLVLLDTPRAIETFATLLRRADHLQEEDPAFQAELREWTAVGAARPDGVARTAGGPRPIGATLLKLRHFPDPPAADREFEQEPLVVVVTTSSDTVRDQVRAGQAMQRVLLAATVAGLSTSFLSQPVEVPYTREALRTLVGAHPHTVLRIGYGFQSAPTARRPVAEVASFPTDEETVE